MLVGKPGLSLAFYMQVQLQKTLQISSFALCPLVYCRLLRYTVRKKP